jgi:hypothetical protein
MIPPWVDALIQDVLRAAIILGAVALIGVLTMLAGLAREKNATGAGKRYIIRPVKGGGE